MPTSCYTGSRAEPTPWYVGDAVAVQSDLDPADARRGGGVTHSIDDRPRRHSRKVLLKGRARRKGFRTSGTPTAIRHDHHK